MHTYVCVMFIHTPKMAPRGPQDDPKMIPRGDVLSKHYVFSPH